MKPLVTTLFALAIAALSQNSFACKCVGLPEYDAVFEGRVESVKIAQPKQYNEVRLSLTRSLKGPSTKEITVYTPTPVLMCGASFTVGKSYLVYASLRQGRLETKDCDGTKEK